MKSPSASPLKSPRELPYTPIVNEREELTTPRQKISESFYRSSPMTPIQLYIPVESVLDVTQSLGEWDNGRGIISIDDQTPLVTAFQRPFTKDIRALSEIERILKFLESQAEIENIDLRSSNDLMSTSPPFPSLRGREVLEELEKLEPTLKESEERCLQLKANEFDLLLQFLEALQIQGMYCSLEPLISFRQQNDPLFVENGNGSDNKDIYNGGGDNKGDSKGEMVNLPSPASSSYNLNQDDEELFITGFIERRKMPALEKVLWRSFRGNIYIQSVNFSINDRLMTPRSSCTNSAAAVTATTTTARNSTTALKAKKEPMDFLEPQAAFIAIVHGEEMIFRLKKMCQAMGCKIHGMSGTHQEMKAKFTELDARIEDLYRLLFHTKEAKKSVLLGISCGIHRWLSLTSKAKRVFDAMNCMSKGSTDSSNKYLIAEGWCPTENLESLEDLIKGASDPVAFVNRLPFSKGAQCPTYFPTNRFTQIFQDMTDAYGVGRYGEINPSLPMIITFPFLFAVMFGDIGHGFVLFIFSLWMVLKEESIMKRGTGEIFGMIFTGRYVILLMGIFSLYTGLIYNDFFAVPLSLWKSGWFWESDAVSGTVAVRSAGFSYIYPFGIDHSWFKASNQMAFVNSYKMKMSILLGFIQMMAGIGISALNFSFYKKPLDLYCTFLPQAIFMTVLFGYLCMLILFKWITAVDHSITNIFIGMVLKFGAIEGKPLYYGQQGIQTVLVSIAIICVPWMLLAKPLFITLQQRERKEKKIEAELQQQHSNPSPSMVNISVDIDGYGGDVNNSNEPHSTEGDEDEEDIGEVWIHQGIHSIEFILGSVSNTASYLRLWALSLAHAELSHVVLTMCLTNFVNNPLILTMTFPLWFGITMGILIGMEGMSAYLHSLRLHWVEFNNKFYHGDGVKWERFSLGE